MAKPYWNLFKTGDQRPWPKIGVAFMNKDGSYNIRLRGNLTAADKVQMRQPRLKEKAIEQTKDKAQEQSVGAGLA